LTGMGIPVMGHLGLTPQFVHQMGGFKVQGKSDKQAAMILADAKALEQAGAFSIVLEGVPSDLATRVTKALRIPTIGIGAGPGTDGQVLVYHDMLGLTTGKAPKFVKRYANLAEEITRAAQTYAKEVGDGTFPGPEHSYSTNGSATPAKAKLDEVKYASSVDRPAADRDRDAGFHAGRRPRLARGRLVDRPGADHGRSPCRAYEPGRGGAARERSSCGQRVREPNPVRPGRGPGAVSAKPGARPVDAHSRRGGRRL